MLQLSTFALCVYQVLPLYYWNLLTLLTIDANCLQGKTAKEKPPRSSPPQTSIDTISSPLSRRSSQASLKNITTIAEKERPSTTAVEHCSITVMASCVGKARLCVIGFWQCLTAELNGVNFQRCVMFNRRHVHVNVIVIWWCLVLLETMILQRLPLSDKQRPILRVLCCGKPPTTKRQMVKTLDGVLLNILLSIFVEHSTQQRCFWQVLCACVYCVCTVYLLDVM